MISLKTAEEIVFYRETGKIGADTLVTKDGKLSAQLEHTILRDEEAGKFEHWFQIL